MKNYKKMWDELWDWLEEDLESLLSPVEIQGKMTDLENEEISKSTPQK